MRLAMVCIRCGKPGVDEDTPCAHCGPRGSVREMAVADTWPEDDLSE